MRPGRWVIATSLLASTIALGCAHTRPATYAAGMSACLAAGKTEAEVDACGCKVAEAYGRKAELEAKGVVCP